MELMHILSEMNRCFGPSGQEEEIGSKIRELAEPYADEIVTDVMGNVIVHKKGPGPKVMFAAHMDSIGFVVTHIQDDGLLRVGAIGGIPAQQVVGTPVRFKNGTLGTVYEDEGLGKEKREMNHLYLDIGADSKEDALKRVQVGDMAIYTPAPVESGKAIFGSYLDDRICCAALLLALEQVKESKNDLFFVFTVQEEVGLRGAKTAAFAIDPDYGMVTDVTGACGLPGSKFGCSVKCGGGAAIKVKDSSVICHPQMVQKLKELAENGNIPCQLDVLARGGTDGGVIHDTRAGVVTGGVSVPCRHTHCPQEAVYKEDVLSCAKLLAAFAQADLPPIVPVKW